MKNNLYILGLSAAIILHRCGPQVGVYVGLVEGKPARYEVKEAGNCVFWRNLDPENKIDNSRQRYIEPKQDYVVDYQCDNTADYVEVNFGLPLPLSYYRSTLEEKKVAEHYDSLLREGRKLVKQENKIK